MLNFILGTSIHPLLAGYVVIVYEYPPESGLISPRISFRIVVLP
jgi:hypothetical protein